MHVKKEGDEIQLAFEAELVGIKNIKSTHVWRLELDIYEMDSGVVKELFDLINMPLTIGAVGHKIQEM